MDTIRACIRIIGVIAITLVYLVFYACGLPFLIVIPNLRFVWRGFWMSIWGRAIARVIGMRIQVSGDPPKPPFCLVSNHLSYIDVILLVSQMRCIFVAKAEINHWPVIGWLARNFGTMFINRRRKKDVMRINKAINDALKQGDGVVFFPEGTSSRGDKVYTFKASLLDIPARFGYSVAYASIRYQTPPGEERAYMRVCWWGDMTFGGHLFNMLKLPYFKAYLTFGKNKIQSEDRKALAIQLEEKVREQFQPTYE